MKFQGLGSNYDFGWAMKQLFAVGRPSDSRALTRALERRYGGQAYLYSQGRGALSAAVKLAVDEEQRSIAINALTCSVVVEAVTDLDASVVYVDIDPSTAHFDAATLEQKIASGTSVAAVVVQNTYGRPVDIGAIEKVAKKYRLAVIEDLAHSVGQTYPDGRECGTVGDLVMLSFGRDKLLDVTNGGALIVRSPEYGRGLQPPTKSVSLLDQFRDRIYPMMTWKGRVMYDVYIGKVVFWLMYRLRLARLSSDGDISRDLTMPHWQAKLAHEQFKKLDEICVRRREVMRVYQRLLGDELISTGGTIRAAVIVKNRDVVLAELRSAGYELIDTWYDTPIGPARKYDEIDYPQDSCPNAVNFSREVINLPTHEQISDADIKTISGIVRAHV